MHIVENVSDTHIVGNMHTTEIRYLEYSITAPLLMVGVMSTVVLNAEVWYVPYFYIYLNLCEILQLTFRRRSLQLAYIAILVTNLLGIPLHEMMICYVQIVCMSALNTQLRCLRFTCVGLLMTSWAFFSSAWFVHLKLDRTVIYVLSMPRNSKLIDLRCNAGSYISDQ